MPITTRRPIAPTSRQLMEVGCLSTLGAEASAAIAVATPEMLAGRLEVPLGARTGAPVAVSRHSPRGMV
jgi:hypothetical protein